MLEAGGDASAVRRPGAASPRGESAARPRGAPDWVVAVGLYALCVGVALVASAILVAVTGGPWSSVLSALVDGSVRNPGRWGATLAEAAPILIVALGAIVSTRAGLVNIGQEGQLAIGAACAAFVATRASGVGRPGGCAGRRRRGRGGVGRHRRRPPLLAQGAGGDHHPAAGVRRRPGHEYALTRQSSCCSTATRTGRTAARRAASSTPTPTCRRSGCSATSSRSPS